MSLIIPANTLASGGYEVANSLRFNDGSTDFLNHTHNAVTSTRKNTFSVWIKRSLLTSYMYIISTKNGSGTNRDGIAFSGSDQIDIRYNAGSSSPIRLTTNRLFRDVSAWYHIVVAVDTTQGTAANRIKLYVNGVQETSFATANYMDQNYDFALNAKTDQATAIGVDGRLDTGSLFDGYMAEFVALDGSQNAPTDFGEFDEDSGIWKPIDPSGLTFGNAGFYLDFENSGALGADVSGNSNNFTVNNLTAIDQTTDTCTNNSATIGTLFMGLNTPTFSEGNLQSYSSAAGISPIPSSIGLSSGKWYAELKYAATTSNDNTGIGITMDPASGNQANSDQGGYVFGYSAPDGNLFPYQGDPSGSFASYTVGDIMGIYMDLDNMKLYFSKNGSLQSTTGKTINVSNTGFYYFCVLDYTGTSNFWTWQWNFGAGCPFAISSGNTDANGYGNFEYSPTITGDGASKDFFACNTKNLSEYG